MISLLDPTTLAGRDIAEAIAARYPGVRQRFFHTTGRDEHLIAEVAGEASLVSRLTDVDELAGSAAVVIVETPPENVALGLLAWLQANPGVAMVDASQPGIAGEVALTILDTAEARGAERRWYHVPDACLVAPVRFLRALAPIEPETVSLFLTRPASTFGDEGVEELATQAAARLSGIPPKKPTILPGVLAFDLAPVGDEERFLLEAQVDALCPGLDLALHAFDSGVFHGHTAALTLQGLVSAHEKKVRELLNAASRFRLARRNEDLLIGDVTRFEGVALCANLRVHATSVSAWLVADGLRNGVADVVVELLATLAN
jgi:aspartate-semialdehyde dehydrogenase